MRYQLKLIRLVTTLLAAVVSTTPRLAAADNYGQSIELRTPEAEVPAEERLIDEFLQGFYWRLNVLAFGTFQNLRHDSSLNPENVLRIPSYQLASNPRLDLNLNLRQFELGVKPRFMYLWDRWTEGLPSNQQDSRTEFYVNEWIARVRPVDELSISYGRENLQWGPSIILSSSNPFNQQNGQSNPWLEVPGLDYGRAVWIPSPTWATSFIANTGKGRLGAPVGPAIFQLAPYHHFETGYALKIDWTGEGKYFSVIPSYREDTGYRIGYFGGWSVTDAILLYSEGSDGDYDNLKLQIGGSYTFEGGAEVHIEYFHNGHGCVSKKIDRCFRDGDVGFSDPFLRSDYLMLQYNKRDILHDFSVNLRLLYGLNDQSAQLNPILEYAVGEHTQLYLVGTGFMGDRDTEYGSLLKYSLFGGVSYTF